jgi:glutathione S-transferase
MKAEIEIFSAEVCPYAQRTRLMLLEKGIDHSLTEIDLKNKPDWFAEVSPYSKVPVVRRGEDLVWESSVINEYLEELYPHPPLMPKEPGRRALARIWIDFANVKLLPTWYRVFLEQDKARRAELADRLTEYFRFMEFEGFRKTSQGGPFWMGKQIGLVDLCYYPWFERLPALEHYRGIGLPPECEQLAAWTRRMSILESVKTCAQDAAFYIKGYSHYADGTEDGGTARDMRAGTG